MKETVPLKKTISTISLLVGILTILASILMMFGFSFGDAPTDYEWKRRNIGLPIADFVFLFGAAYCFLYVLFRIVYRKGKQFEKSVALVLSMIHITVLLIIQGIFLYSNMISYFCAWILFPGIVLDAVIVWSAIRFRQIEKNT